MDERIDCVMLDISMKERDVLDTIRRDLGIEDEDVLRAALQLYIEHFHKLYPHRE